MSVRMNGEGMGKKEEEVRVEIGRQWINTV